MENGVEICREEAASGSHLCSPRQLLGSTCQSKTVLLHSSQDHLLVGAELLEKAFSSPPSELRLNILNSKYPFDALDPSPGNIKSTAKATANARSLGGKENPIQNGVEICRD